MQDFMTDEDLVVDREEDVYEETEDGSGCEFFFDSQVEAELAMSLEEVV
jgi:hypothetical protein